MQGAQGQTNPVETGLEQDGPDFVTPSNRWGIETVAVKVSGLDRKQAGRASAVLLLEKRSGRPVATRRGQSDL